METAKKQAQQILNELPDDTTLEEIQYHLYVCKKIEQGLKDVETGTTYDQEQVEQRMSRWLGK